MANNRYIYLVDDEPIQNEMLKDYLNERFVYNIKTFSTGEAMLQEMQHNPEIVVLDYHLSAENREARNGVQIMKTLKDKYPETQVIILSGQDKLDVAVDSMKYGAYDYVVKGETAFSRVENVINNISELHRIKTINRGYKNTVTLLSIIIALIIIGTLYYFFFYNPA